jgi:PKD repeat protein/DNA-binding transcriptional ArsR family regulator
VLLAATLVPPAGAAERRPPVEGLVLTASPTQGVAPLLVRFALTEPSGAPPNLSWAFGDGQYLNGTSPVDDDPAHTYDAAGTYRCVVTARWSTGSVNTSAVVLVRPTNLSVAITASPGNGTYPLSVWLNATVHGGTGTYVSFYWIFGDGNRGSGLSVEYTYVSPGRFQVNFTATDTDGRSASASTTVAVQAPAPLSGGPSGGGIPWNDLTVALVVLFLGLGGLGALVLYFRTRGFSAEDPDQGPPGSSPSPPAGATFSHAGAIPVDWTPVAPSGPVAAPDASGASDRRVAMQSIRMPTVVPSPVLSTPSRITDALLRHLVGLPILYPGDLPSKAWTQAGIAEGIGAGQSAVSRVLRRLVAAGIVTVETRHVAGSPRRIRIYRLTDRGERLGRALRETTSPGRSGPER